MKISSIIFILLGIGIVIGMPSSRRWVTKTVMNQTILRRLAIRIGMSIPFVRKRVVAQAMQSLN